MQKTMENLHLSLNSNVSWMEAERGENYCTHYSESAVGKEHRGDHLQTVDWEDEACVRAVNDAT